MIVKRTSLYCHPSALPFLKIVNHSRKRICAQRTDEATNSSNFNNKFLLSKFWNICTPSVYHHVSSRRFHQRLFRFPQNYFDTLKIIFISSLLFVCSVYKLEKKRDNRNNTVCTNDRVICAYSSKYTEYWSVMFPFRWNYLSGWVLSE